MHDRIALPFSCTVQAPQRAIPQPNFVPVSPKMSRRYHNSGRLGSPSKMRSIPFTLSFTIRVPLPYSDNHAHFKPIYKPWRFPSHSQSAANPVTVLDGEESLEHW